MLTVRYVQAVEIRVVLEITLLPCCCNKHHADNGWNGGIMAEEVSQDGSIGYLVFGFLYPSFLHEGLL